MKIVLATRNKNKIEKLTWIIGKYFSEIVPQNEKIDILEDGSTFKENAEKKAIAVSKLYDGYAVATDGGVLIPSLGANWNGLFTRRFIGREDASDFDRIDSLLEMMKDKKGTERDIVWNEAIAIAKSGKLLFSTQVEGDRGRVQETYSRTQYKEGIWQCTVTCYPQFDNKNFFELNDEERKYGEISWYRLKDAVDEWAQNRSLTP